jgi:hypothetical protein
VDYLENLLKNQMNLQIKNRKSNLKPPNHYSLRVKLSQLVVYLLLEVEVSLVNLVKLEHHPVVSSELQLFPSKMRVKKMTRRRINQLKLSLHYLVEKFLLLVTVYSRHHHLIRLLQTMENLISEGNLKRRLHSR